MKPLRSRIRNGETLLGCFLNLGSSLTVEIVGQSEFDWALLDLDTAPMAKFVRLSFAPN